MADVTLAAKFRSGAIIRATGFINLEPLQSMDGILTLVMTPRDNKWELFSGPRPDDSGSLDGVTIAGVNYRTAGDADVSLIMSQWDNEAVPSSGTNNRKMTKRARTLSAVKILCNMQEAETLRGIAET